ncbi:MAG: transcription-repair coupling factor, partial [Bacteroides sp.]
MTITELQQLYATHPRVAATIQLLNEPSVRHLFCGGLRASAGSLFAASLIKAHSSPFVFVLGDLEEAGYFYHDLTQVMGTERILFFPSSFRRAIKYGQKDAANEVLRTEVLSRLQKGEQGLCIVTYPDALAEKVVSRQELSDKMLKLHKGERVDLTFITDVLHSYGFEYVDYVYEPGQYAVRGSIIDVFSFSSEYPYRIDFFGDEVDSIRTFEVDSQLSHEKKEDVVIVPDLAVSGSVSASFLDFIPANTLLAMRDFLWLRERIQTVYDEALSPQALTAQEDGENGGMKLEGK